MSGVRLFGEEHDRCPLCGSDVDPANGGARCGHCRLPISRDLRQALEKTEPLIIQTFGSSQHGKTTYLCALTMTIVRMGRLWSSYACRALSERSRRRLLEVGSYLKTGALPPPRTNDGDEPTVLLLRQLGWYGDRLMIYGDAPGEAFDSVYVEPRRVPFLKHASVTFLIASLCDFEESSDGRSIDMLIDSLVASLEHQGVDLCARRRCAVVVLTKGDTVLDLPLSLRRRLVRDPLWLALRGEDPEARGSRDNRAQDLGSRSERWLPNEERYLDGMCETDEELRRWVSSRCEQGSNLLQIAEDNGITLRFSLVSATGSEPDENNFLTHAWSPRRVIDPLLWALDFADHDRTILDRGYRRFRRGLRLFREENQE